MKTIPAGYRLIVTSWENDGDNYNTKAVEGLSFEATTFLVELIKLFYSKNNHFRTRTYKCFGNMYEPSDAECRECYEAVQNVIDKHAAILKNDESVGEYLESPDAMLYYLDNFGLIGGEFWTRVLESFEVEFYRQELVIEDVTNQFK